MYVKRCALVTLVISSLCIPTEAVLTFADENFFGLEADRFDWKTHPCRRTCKDDEKPQICNYVFVIEKYSTMSKACYDCPYNSTDCFRPHCIPADGVQKTVYVANRQLPGPSIEVCQNDLIIVEVRNTMLAESTSIHWHGIDQKGTPYMDGVPFVTQCPILPGEKFQYTFRALVSGTYFWHSHIGVQRADGLYGPLIIHPLPRNNRHRYVYECDDHHMIINDWMQMDGEAGTIKQYYDEIGVDPTTILVNGLGRFKHFGVKDDKPLYIPSTAFEVKPSLRYRIRLINGGGEDCPIEMSIDNHPMIVISLDGKDIEPIEVDAIVTWPGERVDFVIKTNQIIDNYWIRYRGYGQCQWNETTGVHQVAILRYIGAPLRDPEAETGYGIPESTENTRVLNPYDIGTESSHSTNISIALVKSMDPNDECLTRKPDQQLFINFDFYPLDNYDFHRNSLYGYRQVSLSHRIGSFQLNYISMKMPSYSLLSQRDQVTENSFCNSTNIPASCSRNQCVCTHVLQLKLNSVVELVFVDEGRYAIINHPLHLHGHFFRVVAEEKLKGNVNIDLIKKLDREGKIRRRLDRPPYKDTIKAPGGGYTIVRFKADNPGYWFFHCHFEQHSNVGMALIFKVGEHEDMPPVPKDYPTCGGFKPD
ncbi:laccase-3-like [Copidosoma floridanum]|uniref:laccase-3-like n=1 Tax=Copidosoma floridanum TaxID=29053 RepID=UPI0006C9E486|nr:laccase-3-like [Copidosoma floridanum]